MAPRHGFPLLRLTLPSAVLLLGACASPAPAEPFEQAAAREADEGASQQELFEMAQADYLADPRDEDNIIWLGRRLGYLGRYLEAVAIYTQGLNVHPDSYRILRHRGHRFITLREFQSAIDDLERATTLIADVPDRVEPDGMPNAYGIPTSTSHTNIWYHLGLAYYLEGRFPDAVTAFQECLGFARNDDMTCAATNWLYLSLRRAGRHAEARRLVRPIQEDMQILENYAYHGLLLLYKGERFTNEVLETGDGQTVQSATAAYGVAAWHLCDGETDRARELMEQIVAGGESAAFGSIAAETDLARMPAGSPLEF